ncbi:hypothetical protein Fmac_004360 [Flemingia macrophylla]|uniref:Secreted protein n=1 Tax=Flemingia macrophylla TaxID=520843 RepID=A0ABD1N4V9_9FABA
MPRAERVLHTCRPARVAAGCFFACACIPSSVDVDVDVDGEEEENKNGQRRRYSVERDLDDKNLKCLKVA